MIRAFRIKPGAALRTNRIALEIFGNRQLTTAISAQNRLRFKFVQFPNFRQMIGTFRVTLETRKPIAATFEFNGDNIGFAFVMSAPRLRVNIRSDYFYIVN